MNVQPSSPSSPPGAEPSPAASVRVLVIEDPSGAPRLSELLRHRGLTPVSVADGEAAWRAFDEAAPALVFLDLTAPHVDGPALCRRLRAHPQGGVPLVLAVSTAESEDLVARVLDAGADDFLPHPVDPAVLAIRLRIAERRIEEQRERRRTAHALASTTHELETLFRNLHDVFFSVDLVEGHLIQVSPATERMFGHAPDALMRGGLWRHYLLPPEPDSSEDPWARFRHEPVGGPVVREYTVRRPDGDVRWIRTTVQVQQDPVHGAVRADGTATDITDERRAGLELAQRNEELNGLHRLAEVALTAGGLEQAYAEILEQVAAILGTPIAAIEELDFDRGRLVVTAVHGLTPPDDASWESLVHGSLAGTVVQSRRPAVVQDPKQLQRDRPEWLRGQRLGFFAAFPLMGGPEAKGALVLASPDALGWSDRKTALAANLATSVAAYSESLEAQEALRLSEARYRTLAEELQQANDELESFAYSVSHDLRAPLRTMQGFAHALLQNFGSTLDPEARDYARRIIASGAQSEGLISDLLAYSRLSFEQIELKPVDLASVIESARDQVQAYLTEASAHLTVREPLPTVLGNHTTLVQVVANLLSNAVKFVPDDRKPEVTLRTEEFGTQVRLWVEDNGIGVPRGQEERIFRVFERLADGDVRPGTGIGLAIVRRGIQRIGGQCGVQPRPDRGSAFWIQLPREKKRPWRPWARRGS
ncbi:MAG: ATP-binding protein [Longimicrobiales bacterium]